MIYSWVLYLNFTVYEILFIIQTNSLILANEIKILFASLFCRKKVLVRRRSEIPKNPNQSENKKRLTQS